MKYFAILLLMAAGVTSAQTYQQFNDQLFCHDEGSFMYQALLDYHDGVDEATAIQRADGYLCTDGKVICDLKIAQLRRDITSTYALGDKLNARSMPMDALLKLDDYHRTRYVAGCMDMVTRQ